MRGAVYAGFLFIALVTLSLAVAGGGTTPAAAAVAESSEETTPDAKPAEAKRRPLQSLLQGATPEEHVRLVEERERLSAAAKAFGTDPTAINGYYELNYANSTFSNSNLRFNTVNAEVRLPITPNWIVRATMPYVWADLDQTNGFTTNGASDMTVRTANRLYASPNVALLIGTDVTFPTGSNDRLSAGKYTLGPGGAVAVPLARLRSLFFTLVQDFNSVGGDPSRRDIHFMRVQSAVNTILSERWWTLASMTYYVDWNNNQKTTMNLLGEVGHRFDNHWNVFVGSGAGVAGKDAPFGIDWQVLAGVRWVFQTPLFSEKLVEELPIEGR
jgi:hypothetical protein